MTVVHLLILIAVVFIIGTFHWTRIIACATLLAAWAIGVVALPLYLVFHHLTAGRVGTAVLTVIVAVIPATLCVFAARLAIDWALREHRYGLLVKPWYSR